MPRNLERNPLSPAKRVKQFLAIRLQLILVIHVYDEFLAVENIRCTVRLGEICDEPVNKTKADFAGAFEKLDDFIQVLAPTVKALKAGNDEFLLTVYFPSASLRIRCYRWRLLHVLNIIPGIPLDFLYYALVVKRPEDGGCFGSIESIGRWWRQ